MMIDIFIDMSTKCRGRVVARMRMMVGFIRFKMILWGWIMRLHGISSHLMSLSLIWVKNEAFSKTTSISSSLMGSI